MEQLDGYVLQSPDMNFIIKEETGSYRTNRSFKDGVFRLLFSETQAALELFNALEGTDYTLEEGMEIVTLQDAIYNSRVNDLAFQCAFLLSVVEHQSVWSENMPLRELLYLARLYEKVLDNRKAYLKKRYRIPNPHLYVLYNGEEERPQETVQFLSDTFVRRETEFWGELKVKVININYDKQHPVLQRSRTLRDYALFIKRVRQNLKKFGNNRDKAIRLAIRECIEDGVLKEFLKTHGSEVENMLTLDISFEELLEIQAEERAEEIAEQILAERAEALAEERAEALAAQRAEAKEKNLIRNMAQNGMEPEQIIKMTGLEAAVVEEYLS